jgi:uncharacterized protein YdeI (YjbR/CyaY-like superfamily)
MIVIMIKFTTTIQRFDKKGEKTGWQYIEISAGQVKKLRGTSSAVNKKSFRVKGTIDSMPIQKTAVLPMGDGNFILPINGLMRKSIGKKHGDKVTLSLEVDERKLLISPDLIACLKADPEAMIFFKSLQPSHQGYYSKWIESAKTAATKTKRIVMAMEGFSKKLGFGEMMRANKGRLD